MSFAVVPRLYPPNDQPHLRSALMTATYTFDVFSSLDGFGAHSGNWGGYGQAKAPSCSTTASPCTARSSG